ncbi:porin [Variovorax sp. HJSM1_2]|uniref:porin n=1 Tax=Variovorax sp. HJSM1_2 TaxID=3366263 RepID=UPI003BD51137
MHLKKSLLSVASLCALGTAHAQSSVTLYGIADAFVGQKTTGVGAAKVKRSVVDSDGLANSRWGLKGSEDLGAGLKAEFQLESLFDITTGAVTQVVTAPAATSPQYFSSQAWVGLAGALGSLRLGRQVTPFHSFVGLTNNLYDATAFATTGTAWNLGNLPNYFGRFDNVVSYETPNFSGLSAKLAYGFGEDKTATNAASKNKSLNIKYASGPLVVGYSFQQQGGIVSLRPIKYNMLGGAYDFGVARVVAAYNTASRDNVRDKEWQLGVSVPFGAASIAVGYGRSLGEVNGAPGVDGLGVALLGTYDMSKRTRLYTGWRKAQAENATGSKTAETATWGVGAIHRF